jgi:hypothetical protein
MPTDNKKSNQIGEVTVYSKRKYVDELKKQQEKYLADMSKYKQDSAQWVKANNAYQDSLFIYNRLRSWSLTIRTIRDCENGLHVS